MVWTYRAQHRLDCRSTQTECGCTEKIWQAKENMGWSAWEWQKEARYGFCWPSKSFWVERTPSRKTCQKAQPLVEENRALKWIWWWWWSSSRAITVTTWWKLISCQDQCICKILSNSTDSFLSYWAEAKSESRHHGMMGNLKTVYTPIYTLYARGIMDIIIVKKQWLSFSRVAVQIWNFAMVRHKGKLNFLHLKIKALLIEPSYICQIVMITQGFHKSCKHTLFFQMSCCCLYCNRISKF